MSREDGGWDVQGPWEAVFTRPDGNVLERTVYGIRNEVVRHLAGRIVWYRHNVQDPWTLTLTGPDGVPLTGDAAYEGVAVHETWLEMPGQDGIDVLPLAPGSTIGWAPASQDQPSYSTRSIDPTPRT